MGAMDDGRDSMPLAGSFEFEIRYKEKCGCFHDFLVKLTFSNIAASIVNGMAKMAGRKGRKWRCNRRKIFKWRPVDEMGTKIPEAVMMKIGLRAAGLTMNRGQ
jgi:hypothetical protein